MLTLDPKDNPMIVLSDDDDEQDDVLNDNGKRRFTDDINDRQQTSYGDGRSENEEDFDDEDEEYMLGAIEKNQTLPEDHESVIFNERNQENPLKQLDDIFSQFKKECVPMGIDQDDIETSFACGWPLKDNTPKIAMNVEGIIGPITFPLSTKDVKRIMESQQQTTTTTTCFELETNKILLNLSFQEYIFETILPDVLSHLGVHNKVAKESHLQANRFYICEKGQQLTFSHHVPKGAYGSVLIILPSDFNGGEVHTNYKDQDILFQPETDTMSESYSMAWYNDVITQFQPIENGFQASISFSLIYDGHDESITAHTLQQKRLAIESGQLTTTSEIEKSKASLDAAVTLFKSDTMMNSKYPFFYMLNYSYRSSCINIHHLKHSDRVLAKAFEKVAEEARFHLYVGLVEREVEANVQQAIHRVEKKLKKTTTTTEAEKDCPMDEEGIYLTQSVIYDEYILTRLNNTEGKNILPHPIAIDSKEHQPIIQGVSWYSRCKPDNEELDSVANDGMTVKYLYADNTALVFVPKGQMDTLIQMSKESDFY